MTRVRELAIQVLSPDPGEIAEAAVWIMERLRSLSPQAMYDVKVGPLEEEAEEHEEKDGD